MEKEKKEIKSLEEQLQEKIAQRTAECTEELHQAIDAVLKKHSCRLEVSVLLKQEGILPQLGVIALPIARKS